MIKNVRFIFMEEENVGATLAVAQNVNAVAQNRAGASPAPTETIGNIVGAYKSLVANQCSEAGELQSKSTVALSQQLCPNDVHGVIVVGATFAVAQCGSTANDITAAATVGNKEWFQSILKI
jgi:hypothetical protein